MNTTEVEDDVEADYRSERAYHRSKCSPPRPKDGKIARFFKGVNQDDGSGYSCYDYVWVDRTTGRKVMSYDGADPANTDPFHGADTDEECLFKMGYNMNEMIDPEQAVIPDDEIRRRFCLPAPASDYDYYDYDD